MDKERGEQQNILDQLPESQSRQQLSELVGITSRTLSNWEKKGVVTPELSHRGRATYRTYDRTQTARVLLIRSLREEGYDFAEIRNEICKPRWMEKNMDLIENAISNLE